MLKQNNKIYANVNEKFVQEPFSKYFYLMLSIFPIESKPPMDVNVELMVSLLFETILV